MNNNNENRPIGHSNPCVQEGERSIPWIWEGVLAEGAVTLLSAPEKTGKTTLLSLLLDRRRTGAQLLGRSVSLGKTVLCSEENERLWALRQPLLDFGPDLLFHRPDGDCPSRRRWKRFIDDLCTLSFREDPFDLLVIDTVASFLPLAGHNARLRRWALVQLSLVASFAAGVLILNQSRNVHRPLAAFADIVLEMDIPRGLGLTRRRTFTGVGRYPGRLQTATAELNPEGTDYVLLPDRPPPHAPLLVTLQTLLSENPAPLTRQELLARWPREAPREDTLWRTLARGCEQGLFVRSGTGTKTDAFRYAVASQTKPTDPAA